MKFDKKQLHKLFIGVLLLGTMFAWYNVVAELSAASCAAGCAAGGFPTTCFLGAIFFTVALLLAMAIRK